MDSDRIFVSSIDETLNPPEEVITLTERELEKYYRQQWSTTVPPGIVIDEEDLDNNIAIDEVPLGFDHVSVVYDPYNPGVASYRVGPDEVSIGVQAIKYSDGILAALLRHELSHAIFARQSPEKQKELLDSIGSNNQTALQEFYSGIKEAYSYKTDYFSVERGQRQIAAAKDLDRGAKYDRIGYFWDGDKLEAVSLSVLTDELIAYSVTVRTDKEFLDDGKGWQSHFDLAADIVSQGLDPVTTKLVQEARFNKIESLHVVDRFKASLQNTTE